MHRFGVTNVLDEIEAAYREHPETLNPYSLVARHVPKAEDRAGLYAAVRQRSKAQLFPATWAVQYIRAHAAESLVEHDPAYNSDAPEQGAELPKARWRYKNAVAELGAYMAHPVFGRRIRDAFAYAQALGGSIDPLRLEYAFTELMREQQREFTALLTELNIYPEALQLAGDIQRAAQLVLAASTPPPEGAAGEPAFENSGTSMYAAVKRVRYERQMQLATAFRLAKLQPYILIVERYQMSRSAA